MKRVEFTKAFIRTNQKTWGLAKNFGVNPEHSGIPCSKKDCIPVISIIGTSRDGKSSLLNVIHKIAKNKNNELRNPFISRNGHDVVTNGIDYYEVENKCILIDCQGITRTRRDAKYDHFLTLIVYLISNVIILNVCQRLDLQVFTNLLAVFSFLSEIPEEHRRKDKPILVIRIKDFQDTDQYEENPNYLREYVEAWLTKSCDQYDHIKDAFKMAFDIEIVFTEYPVFTDNRKKIIDVYDESFSINNPTFIEACHKILSFTEKSKATALMRDPVKLHKLVVDLKLNITSLELERYVNEHINIKPYNEDNLTQKMDGSQGASLLYTKRQKMIKQLYFDTFNKKFKNVAPDLKRKIFGKWFDKFNEIIFVAKTKNIELAKKQIKPFVDKYNDKYNIDQSPLLNKLAYYVINTLSDAQIDLNIKLKAIDSSVRIEIQNEIGREIISTAGIYKKYNNDVIATIKRLIDEYDPKK